MGDDGCYGALRGVDTCGSSWVEREVSYLISVITLNHATHLLPLPPFSSRVLRTVDHGHLDIGWSTDTAYFKEA